MNDIFGLSMDTIMRFLLVLLAIFLVVILWIALRRNMMFKIGLRNIPRRPAQTVLIIIGLMLSTLIIAASLGTGDTIDYSLTSQAYDQLGEVDHLVVFSASGDGEGSIQNGIGENLPDTVVASVEQAVEGSGLVDAVGGFLTESVPVALLSSEVDPASLTLQQMAEPGTLVQAEPIVNVIGIEPQTIEDFGGISTPDGQPIDIGQIASGQVMISEDLADSLGAVVGDNVAFTYGNQPYVMEVFAIAVDTALSGVFETSVPGMMMPLTELQQITDKDGQITAVAVSDVGDVRTGVEVSDQVEDLLKSASLASGQPVGVDPIKKESVDLASLAASAFSLFFLLFGLFSIAVGILLIILIFSMLAAERRPEMGMARAVGAQRAQLVQQFLAEGSIYALLAGLVGTTLGVGAAYLIGKAFEPLFGDFFHVTPHVTPRSMVVAYALGVVITLLAVLFSSLRVSRLNIVGAIRDIPDVTIARKSRRTLIWGIVILGIGAVATLAGFAGGSAFPAYLGMSMIPFGLAQFARYFGAPSRLVYSLVSIFLLVLWLLPPDLEDKIFGNLDGDIEMFFLAGIFLVAASTLLIVQNLPLILAGIEKIGSLFSGALPAVRTAIAFPGAYPARTGMTLAMFSLITFSMVVFASFNKNFSDIFLGDQAAAGWDIRADQGGANPIGDTEDFIAALQAGGMDTSQITTIGMGTTEFQGYLRQPGGDWGSYLVHGVDDTLLTESTLTFQSIADGYVTDQDVIQALMSDPTVAVIDQAAIEQGGFGNVPDTFVLSDPDGDGPEKALTTSDKTFAPIQIELQADDGSPVPLTIIGIIDSKIGSFTGLYASERVIGPALPDSQLTSYFMKVTDPSQSEAIAKQIESTLLLNGVQAVSIDKELKDLQEQSRGFLYILQMFMGLGLIVGLAAVGVIAFRNVVERRQQIGMMRAIGFQSSDVSRSFLIEQGFIVFLGALSGAILGILLAWKLFSSSEFAPEGFGFKVPWEIVVVILVITVIAALLMTLIPARQASHLAPAEALRYE